MENIINLLIKLIVLNSLMNKKLIYFEYWNKYLFIV